VLVDSNAILCTLQPRSPQREVARTAIKVLRAQTGRLYLASQNLVEIWVVATRPESANGLGFTTDQAIAEMVRLKRLFTVLTETPALPQEREALVAEHRVSGKATYDARLVAAMRIHGLTSILTFNTSDFRRYRGITAVSPEDVGRPE
jgi:predicted nucleic acid-binding protein